MTVYVDDARIPARVGRYDTRWSHLFADTQAELHGFAARLGLQRRWFQDPTKVGKPLAKPGSRAAENWHYDVTDAKRKQAIALGAIEVTWREAAGIITARYELSRQKHSTSWTSRRTLPGHR
ncbi:DUF4031 domain-containing protein [Mycobacterium avium]|uniref:DUF4031 domain-containing protein n=1 Tax=Mycobacterium avium TaxID=1764 RepID=UPI0004A0B348|nr:DUF4031 domain-containing protein [Mycobacterium avium]KDP00188.1 hypothetical protein MAV100_25980 [Mycobacterium avium subsp. hominissuis 100]MBZ4571534.1 DUF4031 domain-containing protein [Mycobacterium avium subsp. hominissuis]MCA2338521.1 DUF4031 domain-containing protein [Mycobacterium avium]MDO2386505.1 DUF4031 domain-containing protein [Mycobacterium avium subsp. hominissuis]